MSLESSVSTETKRGQLVLVAAIALTVALVPLVLAYLQLGYHDDIHAGSNTNTAAQTERTLEHGLHDATAGVATNHSWSEREAAVTVVRERMAPTVQSINRSGLADGTAISVTDNDTRASMWAGSNCPGGPDRQFGDCETDRGVVVQERDGQTHVLAVAVDIQITTPNTETELTTVIEPG